MKKMKKGLVTILIPDGGKEEAAAVTVDSVLEQTHESVEVIIAREREEEWTYQWERQYRKIQFFQYDREEGENRILSQLFARSRGEWIGVARAGDWFARTAFSSLLCRMKDMEAESGTYGMAWVEDDGTVEETFRPDVAGTLRGARLQHYFLREGEENRYLCNKLIHRSAWEEVLRDPDTPQSEEYLLTRLLYQTKNMAFLSQVGYYRQKTQEIPFFERLRDQCRFVEFLGERYPHLKGKAKQRVLGYGCRAAGNMALEEPELWEEDRKELYRYLDRLAGEEDRLPVPLRVRLFLARKAPRLYGRLEEREQRYPAE